MTRTTNIQISKSEPHSGTDVHLKEGDTRPALEITLTDKDNNEIDLTDVEEVRFYAHNDDNGKKVIDKPGELPDNDTDPITVDWSPEFFLDEGLYEIEILVKYTDDTQETFPTDGSILFQVHADKHGQVPEFTFFYVNIRDIDLTDVYAGDPINVEVIAFNDGNIDGEKEIELRADGTTVDTSVLALEEENGDLVELTWESSKEDYGEVTISVRTEDDKDSWVIELDDSGWGVLWGEAWGGA